MKNNKYDDTKKLDSLSFPSSDIDNKLARNKNSSKYVMTKELFEYGPDKKIPFNLIRSKRRKTSELIIENEKEITLRVPFDKPMEEIRGIIQRKIQWIFRKQEEYNRNKPEIKVYSYLPYSTLPYLGKNYVIEIRNIDSSTDNIEKVVLENNKLLFYLNDIFSETNKKNQFQSKEFYQVEPEEIVKNKIKILYEKWIYKQAIQIFQEKINEFSKIIGTAPKQLQIKGLKNRWGSVTRNKNIVLNINLIKTPQNIVDYVIKHELCHLKIEGHSHHFWKFLKNFDQNYDTKIRWLAINGKNILTS